MPAQGAEPPGTPRCGRFALGSWFRLRSVTLGAARCPRTVGRPPRRVRSGSTVDPPDRRRPVVAPDGAPDQGRHRAGRLVAELAVVLAPAVPVGVLVELRGALDLVLAAGDVDLPVVAVEPADGAGGQHHLAAEDPGP